MFHDRIAYSHEFIGATLCRVFFAGSQNPFDYDTIRCFGSHVEARNAVYTRPRLVIVVSDAGFGHMPRCFKFIVRLSVSKQHCQVQTVQDLADLIWRTPRGLKLRTVDDETYIASLATRVGTI